MSGNVSLNTDAGLSLVTSDSNTLLRDTANDITYLTFEGRAVGDFTNADFQYQNLSDTWVAFDTI